jgi:hypothetical protein
VSGINAAPSGPALTPTPKPLSDSLRGTKVIEHPRLGILRLHHAQTVPTGQPELRMAVYAPADAATREALATL